MPREFQLSEKAKQLVPGIYEHYSGDRYEVIGVAHDSDDDGENPAEIVVYRAQYGEKCLWLKYTVQAFLMNVEINGEIKQRFKYVEEKNTK